MDLKTMFQPMLGTLGDTLPGILGALAILVVGWIVAVILRAAVRKTLGLVRLNERIESGSGQRFDIEGGLSSGVYFIVLLLVLIACFNTLDLQLVSAPLSALVDQVFAYAPKLVAAGVLALVAFILATILKKLAANALGATKLDERLSADAGMKPMSVSLANVLFWIVILLFIPGVLGALEMQGLLEPVQGLVDQLLGMVPNILAAAAIALVGWFVGRILRDLVTNLLSAAGADALGRKAGLKESLSVSKLAGLVVYIFVFVPALIAALDALRIEAISGPATEMLGAMMSALPNIFGAAIILIVTYFVARFIGGLVASLLAGMGLDEAPSKLGLGAAFSGENKLSNFVGTLVVFFAMVFAVVEAANRLGFAQISELVATFVQFGGQVLLGLVIIAIGLWLSNLAHAAVQRVSPSGSGAAAGLARYAILGLVFAMGLRAMGIADEIVNLAFGLTLGAVGVAVALSFGLGGREAAGRQMEHWLSDLRKK